MNWLDIVLLIIMTLSVISSLRRGFSRETVGLLATIVAFLAGIWLYDRVGSLLLPYVSSRGVANFCGFAVVVTGVLILGALLGHLLSRLLAQIGLSWFDRLLGGVFGFLRGVLLSTALIMAILAFSPGAAAPSSVVESRLAPYVTDTARMFASLAPRELKDGFRRHYEQVQQIWEQGLSKSFRNLPGKKLDARRGRA